MNLQVLLKKLLYKTIEVHRDNTRYVQTIRHGEEWFEVHMSIDYFIRTVVNRVVRTKRHREICEVNSYVQLRDGRVLTIPAVEFPTWDAWMAVEDAVLKARTALASYEIWSDTDTDS